MKDKITKYSKQHNFPLNKIYQASTQGMKHFVSMFSVEEVDLSSGEMKVVGIRPVAANNDDESKGLVLNSVLYFKNHAFNVYNITL